MRSIEQTTIKLNRLWKENFPELTLTQLLNNIQKYYNADISYWSNEKLIQLIECYAKDMQHRKELGEPRPNDGAVFDLPFEPFKATGIELGFENCEGVIVPIENITQLDIINKKITTTWTNPDCEKKFEHARETHRADSIILSFAKNETYTSFFTLTDEPDGDTYKLTDFLNRNDITSIRCLYEPKHFSYSIYPNWEGDDYTNDLQYITKSWDNQIMLYLGDIAKQIKERENHEY